MAKLNLNINDAILFRKNDSFISKEIAKITGSSYTHAGIVMEIKPNYIKIGEALSKGFTEVEYSLDDFTALFDNDKIIIKRAKCKIEQTDYYANQYIGKPYGYFDIIAIFFYEKFKIIIHEDTVNSLICSEADARVLFDCSLNKLDLSKEFKKPFSYITPDDIFNSTQLKTIRTLWS